MKYLITLLTILFALPIAAQHPQHEIREIYGAKKSYNIPFVNQFGVYQSLPIDSVLDQKFADGDGVDVFLKDNGYPGYSFRQLDSNYTFTASDANEVFYISDIVDVSGDATADAITITADPSTFSGQEIHIAFSFHDDTGEGDKTVYFVPASGNVVSNLNDAGNNRVEVTKVEGDAWQAVYSTLTNAPLEGITIASDGTDIYIW